MYRVKLCSLLVKFSYLQVFSLTHQWIPHPPGLEWSFLNLSHSLYTTVHYPNENNPYRSTLTLTLCEMPLQYTLRHIRIFCHSRHAYSQCTKSVYLALAFSLRLLFSQHVENSPQCTTHSKGRCSASSARYIFSVQLSKLIEDCKMRNHYPTYWVHLTPTIDLPLMKGPYRQLVVGKRQWQTYSAKGLAFARDITKTANYNQNFPLTLARPGFFLSPVARGDFD